MANIVKLNGYDIKDATARSSIESLALTESGHYDALSDRIDATDDTVEENYTELVDITDTLSDRIDAIASLPEGSTTGDAELIDARTIEGVTFSSLGAGLRAEFSITNNDIKNVLYKENIDTTPVLQDGYVKYTDYTISDNSFDNAYKRTGYLEIPIGTTKITHNFRFQGSAGYVFFDAKKSAISGGNTSSEISTIPSGSKFFMISDYNLAGDHTGRNLQMVVDYESNKVLAKSISNLENGLNLLKVGTDEVTPVLQDGFVDTRDSSIKDNSYSNIYKRTGYLEIPIGTNKITHNFNCINNCGYAFFTADKTVISSGNSSVITTIPDNAVYFMISDYDLSTAHTGKKVDFILTPSIASLQAEIEEFGGRSSDITKLVTYGDSHVAQGLWQDAVVTYFNISSHTNLGVSSSTVAINSSATVAPFVDATRIAGIETADPDTIIIIGGTNDVHLETPMGTRSELSASLNNKNKNTFYGAYSYLIETLLTWKPTLKIIMCTTPQGYYDSMHTTSYEEISNIIKDIANYYSIPVANIFGDCGINKTNLSTYSNDLIHYNSTGNKRVSKLIISTINNNYVKYKDSDI